MQTQLILVKHSLPEMKESLPARAWNLSQEGRLRAERLSAKLISYHPGRLVSSTEPKAMQTAQIIGEMLALPVQVIENLHEHDRSRVPFLSTTEFDSIIQEFFLKPDELVFGSETAQQAHDRFSRAVDSVVMENGTTVIVAHGTVISLFVARLAGRPAYQTWSELGLPSFVVLDLLDRKLVTLENI